MTSDVDFRATMTVALTSVASLLLSECKSSVPFVSFTPRIFTPFHTFSSLSFLPSARSRYF